MSCHAMCHFIQAAVSIPCLVLGRFIFWTVIGPCALLSAVLLNFASLFWFWWIRQEIGGTALIRFPAPVPPSPPPPSLPFSLPFS